MPLVLLREMTASDLPALFAHQQDPVGRHMAAFTGKDPTDRDAFMAHWSAPWNAAQRTYVRIRSRRPP